MKRCPKCGASYEGNLRECPFDRTPLVAEEEKVDRLADRYLIEAPLGRGATAVVYRGRDEKDGSAIALKVFERLRDPIERERFLREARAARGVRHPDVIEVRDLGTLPDGRAFLVMPLCRGAPLTASIGPPMPPPRALAIVARIAGALAAAHAQGIVHRDVKPANVFVAKDEVKVLDFGLARILGESPLTESGLVIGTPAYMSPEQAEGRRATPESDVYSLGVLAFELVTGRRPFGGTTVQVLKAHADELPPTPSALVPSIDALTDHFVLAMLEKRPASRPTASALAALAQVAAIDEGGLAGEWRRTVALVSALAGRDIDAPLDALERALEAHDALGGATPPWSAGAILSGAPLEMDRGTDSIESRREGLRRAVEERWIAPGALTPASAAILVELGDAARRWLALEEEGGAPIERAADALRAVVAATRPALEIVAHDPGRAALIPRMREDAATRTRAS